MASVREKLYGFLWIHSNHKSLLGYLFFARQSPQIFRQFNLGNGKLTLSAILFLTEKIEGTFSNDERYVICCAALYVNEFI